MIFSTISITNYRVFHFHFHFQVFEKIKFVSCFLISFEKQVENSEYTTNVLATLDHARHCSFSQKRETAMIFFDHFNY